MATHPAILALLILVCLHLCKSSITGTLCDKDAARQSINKFSREIKSNNKTVVCETVKNMDGLHKLLESNLNTCEDIDKSISETLDKYFETVKLTPNIANFHQCNQSIKTVLNDKSGCSKDGLRKCTDIARDLERIVKNNPHPMESHELRMIELCKLSVAPQRLEVCMETNLANCSLTLDQYAMKKLYDAEKLKLHQLLYRNTIAMYCGTENGGKAHVDKCLLDYKTLRSTQSCAPEIISRVYSNQSIDWKSNHTCIGISSAAFRKCVLYNSASCLPLTKLMEVVASTVEAQCPEITSPEVTIPVQAQNISVNANTGCLGFPRELEAVLKEFSSHPGLTDWKVYGNSSGVSVILNFGGGYLPKPVDCQFGDC